MSPVEQSNNHVGRAAAVALVGIFVLVVGLLLTTWAIGGRDSGDVRLGDQTFQGGSTERLAAEIADRGPIFYGDVSGRKDRDIILQHIGDDPDTGWYAFLAAPIDRSRDCTWTWQPESEIFVAKCDETLTAPADGEGLPQFPVTVIDGRLDVNLNADAETEADAGTDSDSAPDPDPDPDSDSGTDSDSDSDPDPDPDSDSGADTDSTTPN